MKVTIIGNPTEPSREMKAAIRLKKAFEDGIPSYVEGRIIIKPNFRTMGGTVKDVDLLVAGYVSNKYKINNLVCHTKSAPDNKKRDVYINNFVVTIEVKDMPIERVYMQAGNVYARYKNGDKNVTQQSDKQKYEAIEYFRSHLGKSPFIYNLVWFTQVLKEDLANLLGDSEIYKLGIYLPNQFDMYTFFQMLVHQTNIHESSRHFFGFSSQFENNIIIEDCINQLEAIKTELSSLTRDKLETITKKLLNDQDYFRQIGEKLVILRGRAGTGKTIKLLRIAIDLAQNHSKRCLILTYNLALAADIRRTLFFIDMPDGAELDDHTVDCRGINSFIYRICREFGISANDPRFEVEYNQNLNNLLEYLNSDCITKEDIDHKKKESPDDFLWDHILVDEGQDWDPRERDILFKIFGSPNIVVADGMDQMVRTVGSRVQDPSKKNGFTLRTQTRVCDWTRGVEFHRKPPERKSLRQKANLIEFETRFAEKIGIKWTLEPSEQLVGGKVIISRSSINFPLFKREFKACFEQGNKAYEMMFLVPPQMVGKFTENNSFLHTDEFEKNGFPIWDGSNKDIRRYFPNKVEQHRLLQYQSSRGLEGWTVACIGIDQFLEHQQHHFEEEPPEENQLIMESHEEQERRYVGLWGLIPMTRAIDTLIITLNNLDSDYSKMLLELASEIPDIVEVI